MNIIYSDFKDSFSMYSDDRNKEEFFINGIRKKTEEKIESLKSRIETLQDNIKFFDEKLKNIK